MQEKLQRTSEGQEKKRNHGQPSRVGKIDSAASPKKEKVRSTLKRTINRNQGFRGGTRRGGKEASRGVTTNNSP